MIAGYVVLALLVALVGVVAGLGALLGAATITDRPEATASAVRPRNESPR